MHSSAFQEAVNNIIRKDSRFDPDAYVLVKEALDFTVNRAKEQNKGASRHVSGPELLEGFRDFTLENFGPMSITLLREWGVRRCRDVGDMVFNLIGEQVFGKQESDTPDDFDEIFRFDEAFVTPFLPHEQGSKPVF